MDDLHLYLPHPTPERPLNGCSVLVVEDSRCTAEAVRLLALSSGARRPATRVISTSPVVREARSTAERIVPEPVSGSNGRTPSSMAWWARLTMTLRSTGAATLHLGMGTMRR